MLHLTLFLVTSMDIISKCYPSNLIKCDDNLNVGIDAMSLLE